MTASCAIKTQNSIECDRPYIMRYKQKHQTKNGESITQNLPKKPKGALPKFRRARKETQKVMSRACHIQKNNSQTKFLNRSDPVKILGSSEHANKYMDFNSPRANCSTIETHNGNSQ